MNRQPAKSWLILHERARRHHWNGEGWLSVKSFTGGRAMYSVNRGRHAVDDRSYLILNEGQYYEIEIEQQNPLESFCIFFAPGLIEQAFSSRSFGAGKLLNDPGASNRSLQFFERNYAHDQIVSPALRRVKANHRSAESGWLDEQIHGIAEKLLEVHCKTLKEVDQLSNVRPATRNELYRRACRARDFADAMFAENVMLSDLALVAALSPNHLLRTFKSVFHQTPHEFLTTRRLQHGAQLLETTELSVTEICMAVGFQSLGSFSSLFKLRTGLSPTAYRAAKR